ncbi:hypothetical protein SMETP3_46910 (plasmid) [Serratia marcescens]|uniref:fatty acid desaturase family protein n=1 Tax=Serratia marcescens TaxID=615 RepID=UPI00156092AF|nr:fatty acid desaturase [Serratia marcescens]MBH2567109.1 fatty acid desaturase [Serratia marcescens]MDH2272221.1 fatty acid desaturase [Serratia marcescens]MDH2279377.1 fatty acid desaturase [Serratia marcescens]NRN40375.1 hypothetical protein [Serratia marcescens]BEN14203.1 hypothetical protein SMETP3_46910 [Serratia marcescens]
MHAKIKSYSREISLAFHFCIFITNCLVIALSPWWVLPPFILLQAFFFVGFFEAFHQTVHYRLVKNRRVNIFLGHVFGAMFNSSFYAYRGFHLKHHSKLNKFNDPERLLFKSKKNSSSFIVNLIRTPYNSYKNSMIFNSSGIFVNDIEREKNKLSKAINIAFTIAIILFLIFYYKLFLCLIGFPIIVFLVVEYFIGHSQHYYCSDNYSFHNKTSSIMNEDTTDLKLPRMLSFIILHANLHAIHHTRPGTSWSNAWSENNKLIASGDISPPRKVISFLKDFYRNGPKESN